MSRRAVDPVDAAFDRIVQLTPEQFMRLRERIIGWQRDRNPIADALVGSAPRQRKPKRAVASEPNA